MNVNWKEAILQAQKKIDQVLDIRPETIEIEATDFVEDVIAQNCLSPSQESEPPCDDIVLLEPLLPPCIGNQNFGDDVQTILSSDIENLTRSSSRTASPEHIQVCTSFEKEVLVFQSPSVSQLTPVPGPDIALPNPEYILNQAIHGLRNELIEYKQLNKLLQDGQASLEKEMEENRFKMNEKVVQILNEERDYFNQEITHFKMAYSNAVIEKASLETSFYSTADILAQVKKTLQVFRNQITQMKTTLKSAEHAFVSDLELFGTEMRKMLRNHGEHMRRPHEMKKSCVCGNITNEIRKDVPKQHGASQTDEENNIQNLNEKEPVHDAFSYFPEKSNVSDLIQIIEQLEIDKSKLISQKNTDKMEIEKLKRQLNETLVMYGEKIEKLDELLVDNEELKSILKQQALALTHNVIQ